MDFRVDVRHADNGVAIIHVCGPIDINTTTRLRSVLVENIEAGMATLLLDLEDVPYIDSSGLGILVMGLKRLRERQGDMRIVSPTPPVRWIFKLCGLDLVLSIYENEQDALNAGGSA